MITWKRGQTKKLSAHFSTSEFECQCDKCETQMVNEELIQKLENVRKKLGLPIKLSSAFRCKERQEFLAKYFETAKGVSQHELGNAVDIVVNDTTKPLILPLLKAEFMAIGIAKNFIHVDLRKDKKREWLYS